MQTNCGGVVAKRIRAQNSSSGVSVQQRVGSNPGRDTCVPEQDTLLSIIASLRPGVNGTSEGGQRWCGLHLWQHRLYTSKGAEMVRPSDQGNSVGSALRHGV